MQEDFKWRHFEGEIILWAVRWYCKYGISYRELEEMLKERGTRLHQAASSPFTCSPHWQNLNGI
jgi:transposase-like protein